MRAILKGHLNSDNTFRANRLSQVDSAAATPEPSLKEQKSVHRPGASYSKDWNVADGELPPSSSLLVPWGTICLAVLIQRASDKAAAVRSKALGNLASFVSAWANADHPSEASAHFRQVIKHHFHAFHGNIIWSHGVSFLTWL